MNEHHEPIDGIVNARRLSLTTFRRDGTPVAKRSVIGV